MRIDSGTVFKFAIFGLVGLMLLSGVLTYGSRLEQKSHELPRYCKPWGPMCNLRDGIKALIESNDLSASKTIATQLAPSVGAFAEYMHGPQVVCETAYKYFSESAKSLELTSIAESPQEYFAESRSAAELYNKGVDSMSQCGEILKFGVARYDLPDMKVKI